ncbi:radical SAM protein [Acidobacteriota bacterium]
MQKIKEGKTACVAFGYGCSRSRADVVQLYPYLQQNGWRVSNVIKEADLVLVACCGYKNEIERRSLKLISHAFRHLKKGAKLVVIGCLAGTSPQKLKEKFGCIIVPGKDIVMLDQIIDAKVSITEIRDIIDHTPLIQQAWQTFSPRTRLKTVQFWKRIPERSSYWNHLKIWIRSRLKPSHKDPLYFLRIAKGCMDECSYCAIRFGSGTLVSKQMENIIEEFHEGLTKGYARFKLVAGDIGAYGQDIGTNIVALFRQLLKQEGNYRFQMNDFNMHYFVKYREELLDIIAEHEDRFENISIPIQSGSDNVLRAMKRRYRASDSLEIIQRFKQVAPNVRLSTHILVGFPGETEEDHIQTMDFLKATRFDEILFYIYDDRPGTEASAMSGKVSPSVARKRRAQLKEVTS